MAGLGVRIKTWLAGEILKASDLNAEFDNTITNDTLLLTDDYSATVSQMQTNTDPGEVGTESQATTAAGEIERLRFALKEIKGTNQWYETASTSLATITNAKPSDLNLYLPFDAEESSGGATADVLQDTIARGAILNAASYSTADVVAGDFGSTNKKFGSHSYSVGSGNILGVSGLNGNKQRGTLSAWFRNLTAGDYIAYNPLRGIELYLDGSGFLTAKITEAAVTGAAKTTRTVTGAANRAGSTSFANVILKWAVNGIDGSATDQLSLFYNGTAEGTPLSALTTSTKNGVGGNWFFGSKPNTPSGGWDKQSVFDVAPDSDGWTAVGAGSGTVSGGILTISTTPGQTRYYTIASNVLSSSQTVEWKMRVIAQTASATSMCGFAIGFRDDSENRSVNVEFSLSGCLIRVNNLTADAPPPETKSFGFDVTEWHTYRLTSSGTPNPIITFYIDGAVAWISPAGTTADGTATDVLQFGHIHTGGAQTEMEYIRYADTVAGPIAAGTSGELDDIAISNQLITSGVVTALQTIRAGTVFNSNPKPGLLLPPWQIGGRGVDDQVVNAASATLVAFSNSQFYFAGDGKTPVLMCVNFGTATAGTTAYYLPGLNSSITGMGGTTFLHTMYPIVYETASSISPKNMQMRFTPKLGLNVIEMLSANSANSQSVQQIRWALAKAVN